MIWASISLCSEAVEDYTSLVLNELTKMSTIINGQHTDHLRNTLHSYKLVEALPSYPCALVEQCHTRFSPYLLSQ